MKWLDEFKEKRGDYESIYTDTEPISCTDLDRMIAIVEGAEWRHTPDGRFCAICHSPHPDDFSGDGIIPDDHYKWEDLGHRPTCLYSDEWEGP